MAVRRALGASTGRIVRQLLTESILMGLCGGLLGLGLAAWGKSLLVAFLARSLPTVPPIPLDLRVLGFNLGLAVLCGIVFGMAPAVQAARIPVNERLKESGRGAGAGPRRGRLGDLLVVAEVALAMALLIGAGLLFHSFLRLRGMGSDTPADRILTMYLQLKGARYSSPQSQSAFFQEALDGIRGVPGVQFAGATTTNGLATTGIEGQKDAEVPAAWSVVSPDYFRVMGIPLVRGRNFADSDTRGAPEVAMVSQSFARRYFPNEDCVGRRLGSLLQKNGWMTIVGVLADRRIELEREPQPTLYTFYLQQGRPGAGEPAMTLMVRTAGEPTRLAAAVRSRLSALDPTQAPANIETLERSMARLIAPQRVNMLLLVSFALLALLLGSAGIYGVMSHAVSRRTHEIGIRMALGAGRTDITTLVVGRGLRLVVAGEAVGLAAALLLNRVIASMLFHVTATDPLTYTAVAGVWAAVGLIACYVPARRAVRVDPTVALRA
jgi:putative ABC transport system permease protein